MKYLEVAVAAPLSQTLTYAVPPQWSADDLVPGVRLLVPLGRRLVTGYLLGAPPPVSDGLKIKAVADVLDQQPLFPENMIPFFRWVARYYHHPIGEVIKNALPGGLTVQSGRRVLLTDTGRDHFSRTTVEAQQFAWLDTLLKKGSLTPAATRKLWRAKDRQTLEQWAKQGLVTIERKITNATTKARTEICVRPACDDDLSRAGELKLSERKTIDLISRLAAETATPVPRAVLAREYSGARKALKSLEQKGLINLEERRVYRDPFGEPPLCFPAPPHLSDEQQQALEQLLPAVRNKQFAPFLLHGVTGSGKTEVYLRAAEEALAASRSVLVLVPEIALATQLEGHFLSRFGDRVALLHSGLTQGERFDQWMRLVREEAKIVIGARSAVFAPLHDPGLIIVDEEHDGAYKQDDGLRYHGRDIAVLRASQTKATVILGSATPSVASFHHAAQGKYRLLTLKKRIEDRPMPTVEIVDLQKVNTVSGRPPLFCPELTVAMRENLAAGNQSLIFLNRRGFASLMLCQDCGQTVQCRHCHITLTLHKGRGQLLCHYCGYTTTSTLICANCQSTRLVGVGYGTERIEAELARLFPQARIARLDRDTTSRRHEYLAILKGVHQRQTDILVGTQMITKGHHFPHVTLVGIVWADAGLGLPDFKSGERTFQLLSQVMGRAGRGDKPGRVIVQTHQPQHYSIIAAREHNYEALFKKEMALRKTLQFPPYSRLINLRLDGGLEEQVRDTATELVRTAKQLKNRQQRVDILGPAPALLSRLRGKYRWQVLLKSPDMEALHTLCIRLAQQAPAAVRSGAVNLAVDVDPENML